jgi:hypothetical protein
MEGGNARPCKLMGLYGACWGSDEAKRSDVRPMSGSALAAPDRNNVVPGRGEWQGKVSVWASLNGEGVQPADCG